GRRPPHPPGGVQGAGAAAHGRHARQLHAELQRQSVRRQSALRARRDGEPLVCDRRQSEPPAVARQGAGRRL
ncbi:hypothetical protein QU39_00140, partial [Staphylococcus aureus]